MILCYDPPKIDVVSAKWLMHHSRPGASFARPKFSERLEQSWSMRCTGSVRKPQYLEPDEAIITTFAPWREIRPKNHRKKWFVPFGGPFIRLKCSNGWELESPNTCSKDPKAIRPGGIRLVRNGTSAMGAHSQTRVRML